MSTVVENDIVSKVANAEPRILNIADDGMREMVAFMVYGGMQFDAAIAKFGGIVEKSAVTAKEAANRRIELQKETEAAFNSAIGEAIKNASLSIAEDRRPVGGWTVLVTYREELKNADNSPAKDAEGNLQFGYAMTAHGNWKRKDGAGRMASTASNGSDGRGRREGDVVFNGAAFTSLSHLARDLENYNKDSDGPTRKFLEDRGYVIPEPTDGSDGKKHTYITKNAPAAAAA